MATYQSKECCTEAYGTVDTNFTALNLGWCFDCVAQQTCSIKYHIIFFFVHHLMNQINRNQFIMISYNVTQ